MDDRIRKENGKILVRLQNLKGTYDIEKYISDHRERGKMVERISTYPLVLNHNAVKLNEEEFHNQSGIYQAPIYHKEKLYQST
jgi:hypothetical protein